ncbi:alpha/beta hydrolase [Nannocystaceae bacterium ST9]
MLRALPLALASILLACPAPSECPPCTTPTIDAPTPASEPTPAEPEPAAAVVAEPEALTVTADDGHALRVWRLAAEGPSRGTVLLLHGRTWSGLPDFDLRVGEDRSLSLMHRLRERGYVSYALDLRGYGGTERDASGWLEPDRAAEDLAAALAFVREREGAAPDLLGWSYGALVGQLCVQRHPEAARTLTLYGYPRDPDARTPTSAGKGEPPRKPNTEEAAASDFDTPGTISDEAIAAYVRASMAADPIKADWRATQQFNALDPEAITIPTLVLHGVDDPIDRLWQAKLFTRLAQADKQWVVIPRADHAAHLEQPDRFVAALIAFIEQAR